MTNKEIKKEYNELITKILHENKVQKELRKALKIEEVQKLLTEKEKFTKREVNKINKILIDQFGYSREFKRNNEEIVKVPKIKSSLRRDSAWIYFTLYHDERIALEVKEEDYTRPVYIKNYMVEIMSGYEEKTFKKENIDRYFSNEKEVTETELIESIQEYIKLQKQVNELNDKMSKLPCYYSYREDVSVY